MTQPADPPALESLIARVKRSIQLQEDAEFVPCERCQGKGYHHGFGEGGVDPDWCERCGGPGEVYHPDFDTHDPVDVLKEALTALSAPAVSPEGWRRYAQHLPTCDAPFAGNPRADGQPDVCTCGLDALLSPPALIEGTGDDQKDGTQ